MKILPSITTILGVDWRAQLKDAQKAGLEEIAVFLTGLNTAERNEFYQAAGGSWIKKIPFVHIRHDFTAGEIGYLVTKFQTEKVNIHFIKKHLPLNDLSPWSGIIYIENHPGHSLKNNEIATAELIIKRYAGICLDFAHLESDRLEQSGTYNKYTELLDKYECGCGHISAIKPERVYDEDEDRYVYDWHAYESLSELDYLKRYKKFLPPIAALELTNSIAEQLIAKDYIKKLLT